jgi:predicted dehydrogenase
MRPPLPTRRSFLKQASASAAAVAAGGSFGVIEAGARPQDPVHAGGGSLKIGIVGFGNRGTGAVVQALRAHPGNVLHAAGDAFTERLEFGLANAADAIAESQGAGRIDVPPERRFVGLSTIDQVLATGVNAVLLASPPGFRPAEIEKAVNAGVHVFAEKPIATDAPGVRRVHAACELAKQKGLSIVSGLVYRYHQGRRALLERLHNGAIGEVVAIQGNYLSGPLWHFPVDPKWPALKAQIVNWVYWPWLSGDLIAEQHVHTLDMMAWIKGDEYPVAAASLGGRQSRTDPKFGTVFDHFATAYEWDDGSRGFSYCRQQENCWKDVNEYVFGTKGRVNVFQHQIMGENAWRFEGRVRDPYQVEHDEMFAAIHAGKRIDNGDYMCKSTMMALMGRMAAYTGQRVTWEQAWNSSEVLMPQELDWGDEPPASEVARPGITKFS